MVKKCEELENWSKYSEGTQRALLLAEVSGADAVGLFMSEQFNCNDLISIFQTLADPKYAGELYSVDAWKNKKFARVRGVASDVDFYMEDKYNSYALVALPSDSTMIQVPLVNNYTNSNIYGGEVKCPRFEKLVKIFNSQLKKPIEFKTLSTNRKYYQETKKSYEIYSKLDFLSTFKLNEFDKVVMMANITANELFEDFIVKYPNTFASEKEKLNAEETKLANELVTDLLTLSIVRSIDLGDSEIAYKIDEALKLQISNDLAMASSTGKDLVVYVAKVTGACVNHLTQKLDFSVERIKQNMLNMGFKYKKEPTTAGEAIFCAGNLEKTYGIEFAEEKQFSAPKPVSEKNYFEEENHFDEEKHFEEERENNNNFKFKPAGAQKVFHVLSAAAIQRKVSRAKQIIPVLLDEQILTKKQKLEEGIDVPAPAICLQCVLKKKGKENIFVPVILGYDSEKVRIVKNVVSRIEEQREEDFRKSIKKRLKETLNEMYNTSDKTKGTGTIVRGIIKEQIKKNKPTKKSRTLEEN